MEELLFDIFYGDKIEAALKKDCTIEIHKTNDITECKIEGEGTTLLIVLAALEKSVLKKVGCSEKTFRVLKKKIGTEEV